jgi:uncharacterized membrane protein YccF (DUF307 family)
VDKEDKIMRFIANILWFIFGGFICFIEYLVLGILLCITIVGIPFGIQCFKLAGLCAMPFGKELMVTPGPTSVLGNVLWILLVGWETALTELTIGAALCCTIIGIPLGLQFFKLAGLSLMPFGSHVRIAHVI